MPDNNVALRLTATAQGFLAAVKMARESLGKFTANQRRVVESARKTNRTLDRQAQAAQGVAAAIAMYSGTPTSQEDP